MNTCIVTVYLLVTSNMQGSDRPSFSFPELRSVCGSASAIYTDHDPSSGNEDNDRPYVYLPAFLDTGLPRGNVNERDSGHMRGACHPYPISQPVKVGHTTGVYNPCSLRIVMFPQEEIIESAVRQDLRFFVLIREDYKV